MGFVIYLLILHFIADFLLQSREMGKNKSSNIKYLLVHICIIFVVFWIGTGFNFQFSILNAIIHLIIDAFIWKGYKWYIIESELGGVENFNKMSNNRQQLFISDFRYWETSSFYATIGLDQLLHTITIIILYGYAL